MAHGVYTAPATMPGPPVYKPLPLPLPGMHLSWADREGTYELTLGEHQLLLTCSPARDWLKPHSHGGR